MPIYDKPATAHWIRRRISLYSKRVSLGYSPRVVWTIEGWMALGGHRKDRKGTHRGLANASLKAIRIDLDAHICRHDADDTAAHEVVHLRWPTLSHNDLFERRVRAVRAGATVGPMHTRLPDNLK